MDDAILQQCSESTRQNSPHAVFHVVFVDVVEHHFCRRSGSGAKKVETALSISFARFNSRFSATIRPARSSNSTGYLFEVVAMPSSFRTRGVSGNVGDSVSKSAFSTVTRARASRTPYFLAKIPWIAFP